MKVNLLIDAPDIISVLDVGESESFVLVDSRFSITMPAAKLEELHRDISECLRKRAAVRPALQTSAMEGLEQ